jgi:Zinc finger, C3HC4 type (RING finger)
MIPDTYNVKKESIVNACRSCDWLSNAFRLALLRGDHDHAVSLVATGNVNLHTPFANVKGEMFYPVHCAVLGGNLDLLKFMVDENCCPIKSVRVSTSGKDPSNKYTPIVTSKGRSLLGIAMEGENLSIVRYLIVEKGLNLLGEKDLTHELLCRNFEKLLRMVPGDVFSTLSAQSSRFEASEDHGAASLPVMGGDFTGLEPMALSTNEGSSEMGFEQRESNDLGAPMLPPERPTRRRSSRSMLVSASEAAANLREECTFHWLSRILIRFDFFCILMLTPYQMIGIICFDHAIDCVATPCGHSVCCLECSNNLSVCPVCNGAGTFIKIFRP